MIHSFQVRTLEIDEQDPCWSGILATTMFAMRATYHTTMQAMPMQLASIWQRCYAQCKIQSKLGLYTLSKATINQYKQSQRKHKKNTPLIPCRR